jgi:hypothetical protein
MKRSPQADLKSSSRRTGRKRNNQRLRRKKKNLKKQNQKKKLKILKSALRFKSGLTVKKTKRKKYPKKRRMDS